MPTWTRKIMIFIFDVQLHCLSSFFSMFSCSLSFSISFEVQRFFERLEFFWKIKIIKYVNRKIIYKLNIYPKYRESVEWPSIRKITKLVNRFQETWKKSPKNNSNALLWMSNIQEEIKTDPLRILSALPPCRLCVVSDVNRPNFAKSRWEILKIDKDVVTTRIYSSQVSTKQFYCHRQWVVWRQLTSLWRTRCLSADRCQCMERYCLSLSLSLAGVLFGVILRNYDVVTIWRDLH